MDWRDSSGETFEDVSPSTSSQPARARLLRRRPWYVWGAGCCLGVLILLGAFCGVMGGLAVGVYQFVFHEPTVTSDSLRTFVVQGAPQVAVTNPAGSVTFAPGEDGSVRIEATRRARDRTEDDARKALDTITLDLSQDGQTVNIVARFTGHESIWPGSTRLVDLLITVPVRADVTVNQSAGDVTVGALTGPLSLHVGAGNIHVTSATITGDSLVQVSAGNVDMDGVLAESAALDVHIEAGNATVTLPATTAAHIEASTNAGDVTVHGWPISPHRTSGATLLAAGDTRPGALTRLSVEVEAGNITIQAR